MGILSRFGIGSATVDLRVPRAVRQGETVDATIHAEGGEEEQDIEKVYAKYELDFGGQDETTIGTQYLLEESFTIAPGETREFETGLWVPEEVPVTRTSDYLQFPPRNRTTLPTVEVETGMDIELAVDPGDEDPLDVDPGEHLLTLHAALTDHLDFELRSIEDDMLTGVNNFTQAFEYVPTRESKYSGDLEELECQLNTKHDGPGLGIRLEIESRGRAFLDEGFERFVVDTTDPATVASDVQALVD